MTPQRWKLTLEYDGTNYCGWQIQEEQFPTIQQSLQRAIKEFCQQEIKVQGAGRTDAGVHAKGQVCHFDLDYGERELDAFELTKAINAHMREEPIAVLHAEKVEEDFNARFGAKLKRYEYRIISKPTPLALDHNRAWHVKYDLDATAMEEGAQHLLGHHDFSTFRDSMCQANSPERTIEKIDVTESAYDSYGGKEIVIGVEAQAFLHHQVRNFAGTLKLVGQGKWQPNDVKDALEAKDRTKGGPTAPATGLYLISINYS